MHAPDEQRNDDSPNESEYRWARVYLFVIIFAVFVIIALWIFSRLFA